MSSLSVRSTVCIARALLSRLRDRCYGVPSCVMATSRVSSEPGDDALPWRRRRPRDTAGFLSPAVRRALAETATGGPADEVVPFNTVRKRAATALLASKQTAAARAHDRRGRLHARSTRARAGARADGAAVRRAGRHRRAARVPAAQRDRRRRRARRRIARCTSASRSTSTIRAWSSPSSATPTTCGCAALADRDPRSPRRGPGRSSSVPTTSPAARSPSPTRVRPARGSRSRSSTRRRSGSSSTDGVAKRVVVDDRRRAARAADGQPLPDVRPPRGRRRLRRFVPRRASARSSSSATGPPSSEL